MISRGSSFVFGTVLASTMAASTFALVVYSVLAGDLLDEFGIERWEIGLMVTATTVAGALVSPVVGVITDSIGARLAAIITLAGSALSLAGMGLAPSYVLFVVAAVVSGVFQGIANPSTNKLIAEHVPIGRRGIITGIKQSGVQIGTFAGGLALPVLALAFGWRISVIVFAALAAVAGVVAIVSLPADVEVTESKTSAQDGRMPGLIRRLAVYGFLLGLGGTAVFTYLPLFGQESLGMSSRAAGAAAAVVGLTGIAARIGWGRLAESRLGSSRSLRIMALGAVAVAALLFWAPLAPGLIWLAAVATGLTVSAWNAVGMLAIIETVPSALAGRGSGVVLLGFLMGLGLGSPAMGWSVDVLGSYRPGWAAISVLFVGGWLALRTQ